MTPELKNRLAVAGAGVPLCVLVVYIGGPVLPIGLGLVAALGFLEYSRMMQTAGNEVFAWVGATAAFLYPTVVFYGGFWAGALYGGALLMGIAGVAINRIPIEEGPILAAAITTFGVLYLGALLSFGVPLREGWLWDPPPMQGTEGRISGTLFLFFPIVITWIADTAAYAGGRAFGKHPLAPNISPNKTVEGAVSALIAATIVAPVYSRWVLPGGWEFGWVAAIGFGLVVGVFAIVGDLVESALKRECGVKDSGTILPGHGGVLDRLDSLLWTIPTAFFWMVLFK
ncbi:MAG: phosphatidate cytidylyltransferase [Gemmatimonadota bacterium]